MAIFGENHGLALQAMCSILQTIPRETFTKTIQRIDEAETVGPMVDPTAWRNKGRFEKAAGWKKLADALLQLRDALEPSREAKVHPAEGGATPARGEREEAP
jgi:hypothetical protein